MKKFLPFYSAQITSQSSSSTSRLALDTPEILSRLLFTHFGFLSSSTQALVGISRLLSRFRWFEEIGWTFVTRNTYNSNLLCWYQTASLHRLWLWWLWWLWGYNSESAVSKSFEGFVAGLGGYDHTGIGPIYADTSFKWHSQSSQTQPKRTTITMNQFQSSGQKTPKLSNRFHRPRLILFICSFRPFWLAVKGKI